MFSSTSFSKQELFALLAILTLAAVLRFAYPGVNSFAGDEAHISLDALRMARGGEFVMAGQPSSVNIPFFPASVWLFAIPYAFSPDPLVVTWVVSLVSLMSVVGVWGLARRWGVWSGLIAALYMAASPYAVFYGRSIWQPNLLAPLSLAWAITAYWGITHATRLGKVCIGLNVFLGLFVVQVHFAGIALVPATAYLFLRFRWWQRGKIVPVLIGGALAATAMIPYLYYVTIIDPSILGLYKQVIGGGGAAVIDLQAVGNLLRLGLGWDWAFLGLGDGDNFSRTLPTVIAAGVLVILGLIGVGLHFARGIRARAGLRPAPTTSNTPPSRVLVEITLLWLIISPLVFLRHSTPVLIHYQLVELPALALLAGASTLLFRRLWKIAICVLMIGLASVWSIQIMQTLAFTSDNRPPNSALSSILRESRDAAYGPQQPILFFTHGDDPAINGEAAVFKALLWTREYRILNGDALLILPPYPATLLATLAPFQAWEEIEASGLANDVQTYPRRIGADPFMATRYDGVSDPQGFTLIMPVPFADGTTLIGWRVRRVGNRLRVSTLWRVDANAAPGTYQQYHHLSSDPGSASFDGVDVPLSRSTWQIGDRVIVMADFFKIAPGTEKLFVDVGHYTLPNVVDIARSDSPDSFVRLGPFHAP